MKFDFRVIRGSDNRRRNKWNIFTRIGANTMTPELRQLIEYIAENIEVEPMSGFMPYGPIWNIQVIGLLQN